MELEQLFRITSAIRHVLECLIHHRQILVKRLTAGSWSGAPVYSRRLEWHFTEEQVNTYMKEMRVTFTCTSIEKQIVASHVWYNHTQGKVLKQKQGSRLSEWGAPSGVHRQVVCRHIDVYVSRQIFVQVVN